LIRSNLSLSYNRNSKRIAEVWLDEFKHFFYNIRPQAHNVDEGQLEKPKEKRTQLKCRPFSWYLQNVFVDLKIPREDYIGKLHFIMPKVFVFNPLSLFAAFGELKHENNCLEIVFYKQKKRPMLTDCADNAAASKFYFHKNGNLGTAEFCLNVQKGRLIIDECNDRSSVWNRYGSGALVETKSRKCLENIVGLTVDVAMCRFGAPTQLWNFSVELQQLR
jgi:polypeptide N-acetylgalactosaminyltransferase